jgi:regulator of Ty1 transposition protein 103
MAYSDDAVKAKLAALSETQDSIVTVAQWIMFHRYARYVNARHDQYSC